MAAVLHEVLMDRLHELRYEPTAKRVTALHGGTAVARTTSACMVWEPRRVVPAYAVPSADLLAEVVPSGGASGGTSDLPSPMLGDRPVLDPSVPFAVHSTPGTALDVVTGSGVLPGAAFRPDDADLASYVVLEFAAFDWFDEDEPVVGQPRAPFHRVAPLATARPRRHSLGGTLLADSTSAVALFETLLPARWYVPASDVRVELVPGELSTYCAYKGRASYFSVDLPGGENLVWTYREPLRDAVPVRDLLAFFDERVDVTLDGVPLPRPVTPGPADRLRGRWPGLGTWRWFWRCSGSRR